MTSSITFPKTSGGTWTNRETSMEIHLDNGVYTVHVPLQTGGGFLVSGDLRTLNEARDFAKTYVAETVRPLIAKAYDEALGEHIDRTERRAIAAGVPTWRLDSARRMREYGASATDPRSGAGWYFSVLNDIRRVEESIADVIHHVIRYGRVISCGATGRVRVEETAAKVTCEACVAADDQHRMDVAHGQALAEKDVQHWAEQVAQEKGLDDFWVARNEATEAGVILPSDVRHAGLPSLSSMTPDEAIEWCRAATQAARDEHAEGDQYERSGFAGAISVQWAKLNYEMDDRPEATRAALEVLHAEALRTVCTAPYGWTQAHAFESGDVELNPEGYDEFERCGEPASHPSHVVAMESSGN